MTNLPSTPPTEEPEPSPGRRAVPEDRRPATTARLAVAIALGLGVTVAIGAMSYLGWLRGGVAIALLIVAAAAIPTRPGLAGRLTVNLLTLLSLGGFVYMLPSLGSVATWGRLILAGGLGVGAFFFTLRGARVCLPRLRSADWLIAGGLGFGLATYLPWLRVTTASESLALFNGGWDYSSHIDMLMVIRDHGRLIPFLSAGPDGTPWRFFDYPQAFHGSVTALSEMAIPARSGIGAEGMIVATQAVGWYLILAMVLATAAIAATRPAIARPLVALPGVALFLAAVSWGPGKTMVTLGFINVLGSALVAIAAVLLLAQSRNAWRPTVLWPVVFTAMSLLASWLPLAILAGPLCLALFVRNGSIALPRGRWSWVQAIAAGVLVIGAGLWAVRLLAPGTASNAVGIGGGADSRDLFSHALFVGIVLALGAVVLATIPRPKPADAPCLRAEFVVLVAAVLTAAFAVFQIRQSDQVGYYGIKMLQALGITSLGILPVSLARALESSGAHRAARRPWALAASAIASLALMQSFGLTLPDVTNLPTANIDNPLTPLPGATGEMVRTLDAANVMREFGPTVAYVAVDSSGVSPGLHQFWASDLAGLRTVGIDRSTYYMPATLTDVNAAIEVTAALIEREPAFAIVVQPEYAEQIRTALADRGLDPGRVHTWS